MYNLGQSCTIVYTMHKCPYGVFQNPCQYLKLNLNCIKQSYKEFGTPCITLHFTFGVNAVLVCQERGAMVTVIIHHLFLQNMLNKETRDENIKKGKDSILLIILGGKDLILKG